MRQVKTTQDIKNLGTIMCVWAHPDDESFSCAGIMAAAVQNGQTVICITATKGEAGVQDPNRWPPEKLAEIRAQELKSALDCVGIHKHHWLGYHDGHCHEAPIEEAVAKIKDLIDGYKPNTILTFGPDGMTGHSDHQTVSNWAKQASEDTNITVYHTVEEERRYKDYMVEADKKFNIYFNIDKPPVLKEAECDIAYKLPEDILAKKRDALKAMPSQTENMFKTMPADFMDAMLNLECFIKAK